MDDGGLGCILVVGIGLIVLIGGIGSFNSATNTHQKEYRNYVQVCAVGNEGKCLEGVRKMDDNNDIGERDSLLLNFKLKTGRDIKYTPQY
jgi:hypothetical protein